MCENLGASLRSYVDSKQLFTILDCKMLVLCYFVQLKIITSWRLSDIHTWTWCWKRLSKLLCR